MALPSHGQRPLGTFRRPRRRNSTPGAAGGFHHRQRPLGESGGALRDGSGEEDGAFKGGWESKGVPLKEENIEMFLDVVFQELEKKNN